MKPAKPSAPTSAACNDAPFARRHCALTAANAARAELDRGAHRTDGTDWRDVDAADNLDAAAEWLTRATPA